MLTANETRTDPNRRARVRPRRLVAAAGLLAAAIVTSGMPAGADPLTDKQAEAVRVADELDRLEVALQQVGERYATALVVEEDTRAALRASTVRLQRLEAQAATLRTKVRSFAVRAYAAHDDVHGLLALVTGGSIVDSATLRRSYSASVLGVDLDAADELEVVAAQVREEAALVEDRTEAAEAARRRLADRKADTEAAVAEQRRLLEDVRGEIAALVRAEQERRAAEELAAARAAISAARARAAARPSTPPAGSERAASSGTSRSSTSASPRATQPATPRPSTSAATRSPASTTATARPATTALPVTAPPPVARPATTPPTTARPAATARPGVTAAPSTSLPTTTARPAVTTPPTTRPATTPPTTRPVTTPPTTATPPAPSTAAVTTPTTARPTTAPTTAKVTTTTSIPDPPPPSPAAAVAVQAALSQLGVPYVFGAAKPGVAFDCSGLTMWAYAQGGIRMPHAAGYQYRMFPKVPLSKIAPGDLVFYHEPIGHVGIYIGNGQIVHAPYTGTVVKVAPLRVTNLTGIARPG
jgi:cell wall-associated NlpC family hydrolase